MAIPVGIPAGSRTPDALTSAAIRADEVTKSYVVGKASVEILHGVSLGVGYGEMVAVMGASGSGKSTLLYCLAGLEAPTTGQVTLGGRPLGTLSRADLARMRRSEVGFVFQSYNLIPTLTAFENVALPYRLRRQRPPAELIAQTLATVGLTGRANARPPSMSGGEQQRVALARVLAQQPRIVFADEPTGALDTRSGTLVLAELKRIAHNPQQCVLVVTHDPSVAAQCDRILFMRDGLLEREIRPTSVDEVAAVLVSLSTEAGLDSAELEPLGVRQLHLAEVRDSWSAWLGVCVAFIATNFTLALSALAQLVGMRAVQSGVLPADQSAALAITPAQNFVFCAVIGGVVISSSTSLVVDSRRGSLARLALTGATPGQVVATIMSQLAVVSLVCSLVGDALAFAALQPTLNFLAYERGENMAAPAAIYAAWPVLLANVFAVGIAVLGGFKQARRASRIPPVEALRQAIGARNEGMTVGRGIAAVVCLVIVVGTYAAIPRLTAIPTKESISNLLQASMGLLIVTAALLAMIAPLVVGPLTRAWTRMIPSFDPSWTLTRSTTVAKGARLTKSVVPVMMSIGLLFGIVALVDTVTSSAAANGLDATLEHAGPASLLAFLGLPLLVAMAGGVGSLIMMSKQRDAELALSGIVGTTPAQRLAMPIMEGAVIAVTGAVMSLVMVASSIGFLAIGFPALSFRFAFSPSYATLGLAFVVATVVTIAATTLPTVASLRLPEPRVIARLVAE